MHIAYTRTSEALLPYFDFNGELEKPKEIAV